MEDELAQAIFNTVQKNPKLISDLVLTNGISLNFPLGDQLQSGYMPFSVYPCQLKDSQLNQLVEIQQIYQKLAVKASYDREFCNLIFYETAKNDSFVRKILDLYNETYEDTRKQISCTIARIDYLKDSKCSNWLLVEYNLFASGSGNLSQRLQHVNSQLKRIYLDEVYSKNSHIDIPDKLHYSATQQCIYEAWKMYGNPQAILLIIHEAKERNIFDQRASQYHMLKKGVKVIRTIFNSLLPKLHLSQDRVLSYQNMPVGLVYFRAGFIPSHYDNDAWSCRRIIQLSQAVKVPTLGMQLINFKIVQQHFYSENILRRYLSQEETTKIMKVSTPMWNFQQNPEDLIELVREHPQDYVLKPNRQGGGNNMYGSDIIKKIQSLTKQQLKAYVLMYRIKPTKRMCVMFKKDYQLTLCQGDSELGLYGSTICKNGQILKNVVGGTLVRTKEAHCNEGGIIHGSAVMDSIALVKSAK